MIGAEFERGQHLVRNLRPDGEHHHVAAIQHRLVGGGDRHARELCRQRRGRFRIARRDQDRVAAAAAAVQARDDRRRDRAGPDKSQSQVRLVSRLVFSTAQR